MSERLQLTVGPEDPFYQVWQRVGGKGEGEKESTYLTQMPEISLNEWLQRLLRQAAERHRLCRSWQVLGRFSPLCRREREILGSALFLRTGLGWREETGQPASRDLPQDCRRLCLLFYQSAGNYERSAETVEGERLREQILQLAKACHRAGEECERLLGEVLKRQGYI